MYIDGEMTPATTSATNYTHYPMKLTKTTHSITVVAFNDSIIGDTITTQYETALDKSSFEYIKEMTIRKSNNTWITYYRMVTQLYI